MSKSVSSNEVYMRRALELAQRAQGKTSPNPLVGAVFVKNGKIIAEGYHHKPGSAHAEVNALSHLTPQQIQGGTLYVTLEPCSHFGRTPPCANFLIDKGVKNVVIAMRDPNPKVNGGGISLLKKAGVTIKTGLLKQEAEKMNEIFIHAIQHQTPFVFIKVATSLDGKIAAENGDSKWITNETAREKVHILRNNVDAILTSATTVIADNPHLGSRISKNGRFIHEGKDPLRIILDSQLKTSLQSQVYRDDHVIVATNTVSHEKKHAFEKKGIIVLSYRGEKIPLKNLLKDLYKKGVNSIMIEAGGGIITAFLKEKLVQKGYFFIAPKIIGNKGISFVNDLKIKKIAEAEKLKNVSFEIFDDNILMTGYF